MALALLGVFGAATTYFSGRSATPGGPGLLTYPVAPVSVDVKIKLSGELKAIKNEEVRNLVEGQTTILWIPPEGTKVKEGDVLVRLAADAIKDKVEDARIRVETAKGAAVNASQTLTIQQNQNESDTKAAEINAELARLEFEQFDKGDSKVEIATRKTTLANAQTDLERKTEDLRRVKELSANGFVSSNDVLDAQIAFRDASNKLETAKMDLNVWNLYAEPRQRQTLARKRDEAAREMERTRQKANAAVLLKEADVRAKDATLRVESNRLASLETQLENCVIKAPQAGMVVYQSSTVASGWWNPPIEEGLQVRQNQTLIQLPDTSRMMVEVRVAEQLTDRIKPGLDVFVNVDALPGRTMKGKVSLISVLPDNSNRQSSLKEYPTQILLDVSPEGLKPGMSAKAEIMIASLQDVIAVPVQAVFAGATDSYVYVGNADNYEKRTVKTGLSSADQIQIVEGLTPGEDVLLSRPKTAAADEASAGSRPAKDAPPRKNGAAAREGGGGGKGGAA
ncbi:MAG: efflux RND transporter periplasmic adaptor subunit [Phycisphaerae bacterium]